MTDPCQQYGYVMDTQSPTHTHLTYLRGFAYPCRSLLICVLIRFISTQTKNTASLAMFFVSGFFYQSKHQKHSCFGHVFGALTGLLFLLHLPPTQTHKMWLNWPLFLCLDSSIIPSVLFPTQTQNVAKLAMFFVSGFLFPPPNLDMKIATKLAAVFISD